MSCCHGPARYAFHILLQWQSMTDKTCSITTEERQSQQRINRESLWWRAVYWRIPIWGAASGAAVVQCRSSEWRRIVLSNHIELNHSVAGRFGRLRSQQFRRRPITISRYGSCSEILWSLSRCQYIRSGLYSKHRRGYRRCTKFLFRLIRCQHCVDMQWHWRWTTTSSQWDDCGFQSIRCFMLWGFRWSAVSKCL